MRARVEKEDGFGLIELMIAMVVLNVALFALLAAFNSGSLAVQRAALASNGSAVADKVMEVYRGLQNKSIYLDGLTASGNDVAGYPAGIPNSTSAWYALYSADTAAYRSDPNNPASPATYYVPGTNTVTQAQQRWVTNYTDPTQYNYPPIEKSVAPPANAAGIAPTAAVQAVTGPDGQAYPVFTYIILVQPSGLGSSATGWVKWVTVVVRNPRNPSQVLARTSSLFERNVAR